MGNVESYGIPGSGMPYHLGDAYKKDHPCYASTDPHSLGKNAPLQPQGFLHPSEIGQIMTNAQTTIRGRGETTYAECRAFFGTHTLACANNPKIAEKQGTASSSQ